MAFLFRLLSRLPLPLLHNLGALFGWLHWLAAPAYRRHLRENMALAGVGEAWPGAVAEAGKTIFELPKLWARPHAEVVGRVARATGWHHVEEAAAVGRGIVFLTPHLGCFEITAQYIATAMPLTVLYRRSKHDWLVPLMEAGRGASLKLAPADLSGVRRLMKALRRGEAVGMLPDQIPRNGEGVWAPFFGRPAYTMTLAARMAEGATPLLVFAERLPYGAGYHVRFQPLAKPLSGDLGARTAQINQEMEALIRQWPEQYLWGYNRYKRPRGVPAPA